MITLNKLQGQEDFPWDESERCVACGLCLPHCPTYRKKREETASPRGRIALMRAMVHGDLELTDRLESHLDLCLTCRACEAACPSSVRYGELIDSARAIIHASSPMSLKQKLVRRYVMDGVIAKPENLMSFGKFLRFYQNSGLQRLVRASRILKLFGLHEAERQMPWVPEVIPLTGVYTSPDKQLRGRVALFTGCIARIIDRDTLEASIQILAALGYEVVVPEAQNCCGAIHQHTGEPDKAAALAQANIDVFLQDDCDFILHTATGCGVQLKEYALHLPDSEAAKRFSGKVMEITEFIARDDHLQNLTFEPLMARAAIHEPCSARNVLKVSTLPAQVLAHIPELMIEFLDGNQYCCGAAGVYHLTQPEMSASLLHDKVEAMAEQRPDYVVSTNIGCAMQLVAGIGELEKPPLVIHPLALLAQQLRE